MQPNPDELLNPQECVAVADLISAAMAQGSNQKRLHLHLENKLLKLAEIISKPEPEEARIPPDANEEDDDFEPAV